MNEISNILFAVCGFGCVCCGAFVLGFGLLARVFGVSLVLPAIAAVSNVIFNRGDNQDDQDVDFDERAVVNRGPDLQARIQAANQQFAQSLNTNVSAQSFSAQGYAPRGVQAPSPQQPPTVTGGRAGQGGIPGQSPFEVDLNANLPYGSNIRQGSNFNPGGQPPPAAPPGSGNRFGINPSLDGPGQSGQGGQPMSAADRLRQRGYSSDLGPIDMPGLRRNRSRYDEEEEYFGSEDDNDNGLLDFFE